MNETNKALELSFELLRDIEDLEDSNDFKQHWWDRYRRLKAQDTQLANKVYAVVYKFMQEHQERDRRINHEDARFKLMQRKHGITRMRTMSFIEFSIAFDEVEQELNEK